MGTQELPIAAATDAELPVLVRRGRYIYPPGLRLNLPFYLFRKFFKPGNPILLFEHMRRYGRAAHYKILLSPRPSCFTSLADIWVKSSSTKPLPSAKTAPRSA